MRTALISAIVLIFALAGCGAGLMVGSEAGAPEAGAVSDGELIRLARIMRARGDVAAPTDRSDGRYALRLARLTGRHLGEDGLALSCGACTHNDISVEAGADGSIRFGAGLMDMMTDQELLFLFGHVVGHLKNGDSLEALRAVWTGQARSGEGGSSGGPAGTIDRAALDSLLEGVRGVCFSREQEAAADRYGDSFMEKHGYDRKAAVSALKKLAGLGVHAGFLARHPDAAGRAGALASAIAAGK